MTTREKIYTLFALAALLFVTITHSARLSVLEKRIATLEARP